MSDGIAKLRLIYFELSEKASSFFCSALLVKKIPGKTILITY